MYHQTTVEFLFSQQMRHGLCRRVAKLKGKEKLGKLEEMLKEPGFQDDLKWVTSSELNAETDRGKAFIDRLMPYFRDKTGAGAWTTIERQASKSEMFALMYTVTTPCGCALQTQTICIF